MFFLSLPIIYILYFFETIAHYLFLEVSPSKWHHKMSLEGHQNMRTITCTGLSHLLVCCLGLVYHFSYEGNLFHQLDKRSLER